MLETYATIIESLVDRDDLLVDVIMVTLPYLDLLFLYTKAGIKQLGAYG